MTVTAIPPTRVRSSRRSALVVLAVACGFVMTAVDATVVNVVGPVIETDLPASLSQLTWIVDGYVLTFAALLPIAGSLADRFGPARTYGVGTVVFVVASAAAAAATDPVVLIAARAVQGIGAAVLVPPSLGLLVHAFPEPERRARVLAAWSAVVAAASALGPTLGGVLVQLAGWRSVFLINVPIGLLGLALTVAVVPRVERRPDAVLSATHLPILLAVAGLSVVLIEGPALGWAAPAVVAGGVVTVASVAVVGHAERRARASALPWHLFADARFAGADAIGFLFSFALFGSLFLLGLYLQHDRGATPVGAGLQLLPVVALSPFANLVFGRLHRHVSTGRMMTACLLVAALTTAVLVFTDPGTPYWVLGVSVGVASIALGVVSPAMTATMVEAAGPRYANHAGSVLMATRQLGLLVGVAVVGALMTAVTVPVIFSVLAGAYLVAAVISGAVVAREQARQRVRR